MCFGARGRETEVETGPETETNGGKDRLFFLASVGQVVCIFHLVSRRWKCELTTLRLISSDFPFNSACGLAAARGGI